VSTTPETGRIRWTEADDETGPVTGHVGTLGHPAFVIWPPLSDGDDWRLACGLSNLAMERIFRPSAEELKAEAERWLEEFVSSLDASFGPDARWSALGDWLYAQIQDANMAERAAFADGLTDAEVRHSTRGAVWRAALEKMHELESGERTGDGEPR
jgi:hypothetical protein